MVRRTTLAAIGVSRGVASRVRRGEEEVQNAFACLTEGGAGRSSPIRRRSSAADLKVQCTGKNAYDALDKGAKGVSRVAHRGTLPAVALNRGRRRNFRGLDVKFPAGPAPQTGKRVRWTRAWMSDLWSWTYLEQFNVSHTVNKIAFGPEHHPLICTR